MCRIASLFQRLVFVLKSGFTLLCQRSDCKLFIVKCSFAVVSLICYRPTGDVPSSISLS